MTPEQKAREIIERVSELTFAKQVSEVDEKGLFQADLIDSSEFMIQEIAQALREAVTPPTEDEIERVAEKYGNTKAIDCYAYAKIGFKAGAEFAIKKMRGE